MLLHANLDSMARPPQTNVGTQASNSSVNDNDVHVLLLSWLLAVWPTMCSINNGSRSCILKPRAKVAVCYSHSMITLSHALTSANAVSAGTCMLCLAQSSPSRKLERGAASFPDFRDRRVEVFAYLRTLARGHNYAD